MNKAYPIITLLVLLVATGCASDERQRIVVYSPHGKELLTASEEAFEAAHPNVDVQWIDMGGQDAYDRIRTESQNPQASIWWGGASTAFDRAAREGLLEPYEPTWSDVADSSAIDPEHYWY
ncbi:MAG TPA: extracellular solute-binding protein, partial [Rhodothermales bacterium]|nr:extracellular solute-binding protein [Rhodothermales bacterium]